MSLMPVLRGAVRRSMFWLASNGVVAPFVFLVARGMEVAHRGPPGAPTLLAIHTNRFRGDLESLASTGQFTILKMPFLWLGRLYGWFYGEGKDCFSAASDENIQASQESYRRFLREFLPRLFKRLGVDVLLGAAPHYRQDYDWGVVSHETGTPFIVFHREGNVASRHVRDFYRDWGRDMGKYHGSFLVLQNEVQRRVLIESGYITEENSAAGGIMRIDEFLKSRNVPSTRAADDRKRVTLFSFGPGTGILNAFPPNWPSEPEKFFDRFCRETHIGVARFAAANPDIDVVFKPKWGAWWNDKILEIAASDGIDLEALPNATIEPDVNVHDLLRRTDVVIGYGSTTLLESGILGLPVIMPYFAEAREERWRDHVMYGDDLDCFDIADSAEHLEQLIGQRLDSPGISEAMRQARERTFETFVSYLDSSATRRSADLILAQAGST